MRESAGRRTSGRGGGAKRHGTTTLTVSSSTTLHSVKMQMLEKCNVHPLDQVRRPTPTRAALGFGDAVCFSICLSTRRFKVGYRTQRCFVLCAVRQGPKLSGSLRALDVRSASGFQIVCGNAEYCASVSRAIGMLPFRNMYRASPSSVRVCCPADRGVHNTYQP